jgi:hypothetical protein
MQHFATTPAAPAATRHLLPFADVSNQVDRCGAQEPIPQHRRDHAKYEPRNRGLLRRRVATRAAAIPIMRYAFRPGAVSIRPMRVYFNCFVCKAGKLDDDFKKLSKLHPSTTRAAQTNPLVGVPPFHRSM